MMQAPQPLQPLRPIPPHLQDRYHLLVQAVEGIRDYAIFMLDPSGNILTWNAGAERIKGYAPEEIIGRNFSIFYTAEDLARDHPREELRIAEATGRYEEEGWRLKKDGTPFWASVLITRITDSDGRVLGYSKVTRDLSERRKADEALRASEERFRQLVNGVKDYAIFMLDAQGMVATWNDGARRLTGYESDEILGRHFSRFYPAEDVEGGKCEYELAEAAMTGRFEDEGWRIRKDGTRFWANVVISAARDSRGNVMGYSKVTRDLTERKRAEDRLRRANEDLERRVEKRTEELRAALETRDQFLSIASHELKTPLTSLKLQAQMLRTKVDPASGRMPPVAKLAASLDTVLRQIGRLTGLVDDLLDVGRVQAGKFSFAFAPIDFSEVVRSSVAHWEEALTIVGCPLHVEIAPGVRVEGDAYRLEQVLSNLLSNITKYACEKPAWVTLREEGSWAVLTVRDQGVGIAPDKQHKVFERFERVAENARVSGLGLGLFICKSIVEAHRGSIRLASEPGVGSTFEVRLPVLEVPTS